jgi:hypothetical protein
MRLDLVSGKGSQVIVRQRKNQAGYRATVRGNSSNQIGDRF